MESSLYLSDDEAMTSPASDFLEVKLKMIIKKSQSTLFNQTRAIKHHIQDTVVLGF